MLQRGPLGSQPIGTGPDHAGTIPLALGVEIRFDRRDIE
jgi:hypothetical protein